MVTFNVQTVPKNFPAKSSFDFKSLAELADLLDDFLTDYVEVDVSTEEFHDYLKKSIEDDKKLAKVCS